MSVFDNYGEDMESPFAVTEAETPVQDSDKSVVDEAQSAPETELSVDETETPTITEEAPEEVKEVEEAPKEEPETDEDKLAAEEKEIEARLADDKSPKWFKNAVNNVYVPKIQKLSTELEAYQPLGKPEELAEKVSLLDKLGTVRSNPTTGTPERTTEEFVKTLYEKDPQVTYQLINDLSSIPSPNTPGYTVLQEMFKQVGIDPARLEEVKTFAANGYQLQQGQYPPPDAEDMALIPEHLQATFTALSPDRRDDLLASADHVRNEALEDAKLARDTKQRDELTAQTSATKEAEEQAAQVKQFNEQINVKATETFNKSSETVYGSFVQSLAKQAGMSNMDSVMIANTVLNSFEPTLAGREAANMLKAEGIEVDPIIATTIEQLDENARHIAYFELTQDRGAYEKAVAKQVELQEKLAAKGNKIIASLALKKSAITNTAKLAPPSTRHATAGVGASINSQTAKPVNFSDEAYLENLRASGFGVNR